jgi:hypothetical protein
MKKQLLMMTLLVAAATYTGFGQLQRGNVLIGADLANINLNLNKGGNFNLAIQPKVAWFIRDNKAVGGYFNVQLSSAKGAGTTLQYGIGGLGRYYIGDKSLELNRHSRFFVEANLGIEGFNPATGDNTNGLGLGIGPGLAYFITPNIGLEGLLKYGTIVGFGSATTTNNLSFQFGFNVYLPRRTIKQAVQDVK